MPDLLRYDTTRDRRGSCYLTDIGTLAIQPLTPLDQFLAISYFPLIRQDLSKIFEHVQNVTTGCDSLQEGLTLHDIVTTSASWGQSQCVAS